MTDEETIAAEMENARKNFQEQFEKLASLKVPGFIAMAKATATCKVGCDTGTKAQ